MNIICKECGTENEQEYIYCKNCGASLEKKEEKTYEQPPQTNFNNTSNYTYNEPFYDGVTPAEMTLFIGKKANEILPKFQKMKITDSKISWCWPLALLSFVFGPFGAALWFFYRKMYKYAFIFSGIGFTLSAIIAALTFNQTNLLTDTLMDAFMSGDFQNFMQIIESVDTTETGLALISGALQDIVDISTSVVTGIFGYHIYMSHCIQKIQSYKFNHNDPRFYQMGLSAVGGVSGGMLGLGFLIMLGTEAVISFITNIITIII